MGGTETDRQSYSAVNVGRNYFRKGEYAQALRTLANFNGTNNTSVLILTELCKYRLGQTDTLAPLHAVLKKKVVEQDDRELLFYHEVMGHVVARRFEQAIGLLESSSDASRHQHGAISLLRDALDVLQDGQSTSRLETRRERFGVVAPREKRSIYLTEAKEHLFTATERTSDDQGDQMDKLINLTGTYMLYLIERDLPDSMRNNARARALQATLREADPLIKRSLPYYNSPIRTITRHRF